MSIDLAATWRVKDNRTVENLHGHWIADTGGKNHSQLIAAAPELLEALQEMVAIVKKHTYPQPDKPSSTWGRMEAAEAVISKALGQ